MIIPYKFLEVQSLHILKNEEKNSNCGAHALSHMHPAVILIQLRWSELRKSDFPSHNRIYAHLSSSPTQFNV